MDKQLNKEESKQVIDPELGAMDRSRMKEVDAVLEITREAAEEERQLGVIEAFKTYPKAALWSMFVSITLIMCGYDIQIMTSFYAMSAFAKKYGSVYDGEYQISAAWQSALSMGYPVGQIIGSLACSWPAERWGRKPVFICCNTVIIGLVFIQFFAPSLAVLCVGEMLCGQLWGAFVTLAPTYASEVAPVALRGVLEGYVNLAFIIGQFASQGVLSGFQSRDDQWAYRIPFAIQWVWPVVLLIGLPFAPESPWWLVRKGRSADAKGSLQKLAWVDGANLDKTLMIIEQTDLLEREAESTGSYMDIFRGTNLRRTEICALAYMTQVLSGNTLMGYYTYFFKLAGLAESESFYMAVGNTAIGFVATCLSFVLVSYFGRRRIYNTGLGIMTVILFIIAILDCVPGYEQKKSLSWSQASLLDVWTFFYQLTIGPVTFIIISEISSTKLRSRTIAFATAAQSCCSIVTFICVPYMFNPENANMRGKICFFFGPLSLICCVWSFFRLPETQNRTFEEIDIMFERRIRTRDFKNYDPFESCD